MNITANAPDAAESRETKAQTKAQTKAPAYSSFTPGTHESCNIHCHTTHSRISCPLSAHPCHIDIGSQRQADTRKLSHTQTFARRLKYGDAGTWSVYGYGMGTRRAHARSGGLHTTPPPDTYSAAGQHRADTAPLPPAGQHTYIAPMAPSARAAGIVYE